MSKLEQVQAGLLEGGLAASTPVAMIENASLPQQRECRSSLADMYRDALTFKLKSPAILVIGEVAARSSDGAFSRADHHRNSKLARTPDGLVRMMSNYAASIDEIN